MVHTVHELRALHSCCHGLNQCRNLVKCRYAVIRIERGAVPSSVHLGNWEAIQQTSNDVKLSEPGGFQPPRCHHRKFVPLSQPIEKI